LIATDRDFAGAGGRRLFVSPSSSLLDGSIDTEKASVPRLFLLKSRVEPTRACGEMLRDLNGALKAGPE
jgi:hypothetical protein